MGRTGQFFVSPADQHRIYKVAVLGILAPGQSRRVAAEGLRGAAAAIWPPKNVNCAQTTAKTMIATTTPKVIAKTLGRFGVRS